MIHPILQYTIAGVIWYQGEANAGPVDAIAYRWLFPALIKDWRKQFGQPRLPFLYVQLANYSKKEQPNQPSSWAELRESQLKTLELADTGMAVIIDIGNGADIHPRNKKDVGKRLELIALNYVYGQKVPFSGPIFEKLEIKADKAICSFKYCDRGLKTKNGDKVPGFIICGSDNIFRCRRCSNRRR